MGKRDSLVVREADGLCLMKPEGALTAKGWFGGRRCDPP